MRFDLVERRRDLVKQRNYGFPLHEVVKLLATKYQVTPRTLYYDWARRSQWLPALLEIADSRTFFLDIVSQHREIYQLAVREYLKADNSSAAVGALRLLRDLNLDFVELVTLRDATQRITQLEARS